MLTHEIGIFIWLHIWFIANNDKMHIYSEIEESRETTGSKSVPNVDRKSDCRIFFHNFFLRAT